MDGVEKQEKRGRGLGSRLDALGDWMHRQDERIMVVLKLMLAGSLLMLHGALLWKVIAWLV